MSFSTIIVVNEQLNCSSYNPCGRFGYCQDNVDGEVTCECKFWWNGTYCDQQTNSGTQVIILACLLAFLILLLYGLSLIRWIRNRLRRRSKE